MHAFERRAFISPRENDDIQKVLNERTFTRHGNRARPLPFQLMIRWSKVYADILRLPFTHGPCPTAASGEIPWR